MASMMQIKLEKVKFFGFHGLVPGEEIIGGEYEVNLTISYQPVDTIIIKLEDSVDYTLLFSIVKQRMQKPTHLLENLATEIASEIIAKIAIVTEVDISIYKLQPPIENFQGMVGVNYTLNRN